MSTATAEPKKRGQTKPKGKSTPPVQSAPTIEFTAIRGKQAGREYYTLMLPVAAVARIIITGNEDEDGELPTKFRRQRQVNPTRAKKIAEYILKNPSGYVLPSITCSMYGESFAEFIVDSPETSTGRLRMDAGMRFLVNDGQHRSAGIVEAIKLIKQWERDWKAGGIGRRHGVFLSEAQAFEDDHIPVTLFHDAGIKRAQQMFADINRNAVKPSTALMLTFDGRDETAGICRYLEEQVPEFQGRIEFERTSVSAKSKKLFAMNSLHKAVGHLVQWICPHKKLGKKQLEEIEKFFRAVGKAMPEYSRLADLSELRGQSLAAQGIALEAIAAAFASQPTTTRLELVSRLQQVDWSRENPQWVQAGVIVEGSILKSAKAVNAMASVILAETREEQIIDARKLHEGAAE